MVNIKKRIIALLTLIFIIPSFFTACWDNRELNNIFVIVGIALDATENPDDLNITIQIGVEEDAEGNVKENEGAGGSAIILETVNDTILGAIRDFNRDSNHKLMQQHNQIRLFGIKLAENGIAKHIDLYMRDQQSRLEVPMLIVDGNAGEILKIKLDQESRSSTFLSGFLDDLAQISKEYQVRMLDFASKYLQEGVSPLIPIVKIVESDDKKEINLDGFGIFKEDRLIGRLDNNEAHGYIWAQGDVKRCNMKVSEDSSRSMLHIAELKTKRKISFGENDEIELDLTVNASNNIAEIEGFKDLNPQELVDHLKILSEKEIEERIMETFKKSQDLNADILGISSTIQKYHPKKWDKIKDKWDEIYPNIKININVISKIVGSGQILQTIEMEALKNDN